MANDGAGTLIERLAFCKPDTNGPGQTDKFGNHITGGWIEVFRCRGAFTHLRGGESVMQGRLQGKHSQVVRVRAAAQTREVEASWSIVDRATGDRMNIRDITVTTDRRWIEFLCESGVAN